MGKAALSPVSCGSQFSAFRTIRGELGRDRRLFWGHHGTCFLNIQIYMNRYKKRPHEMRSFFIL